MNRKFLVSVFVMLAMLAAFLGFAAPAAAAGGCTLTIPVVNVANTPGTTVTVPININCDSSSPTRGYQFDLAYDASRLQTAADASGITDGGFLSSGGSVHGNLLVGNTPTIDNVGGHILSASWILTGGDHHGVTGTGTLANVVFTVKAAAPNGVAPLTLSNVIISNESGSGQYATTLNTKWVRVGPAPALAIQSIVFNPTSGNPVTSVAVTIKNTGTAMSAPVDDTTVTLAMSACTPATATTLVTDLAAGATQTITQAYTGCGSSSILSVTDPVYGLNQSQTYFSSITANPTQPTNVDGTYNSASISITTTGNINFHPLVLGINQQTASMLVTSNAQSWTVGAVMDNWNLHEWNGTGYVAVSGGHPYSLHNPLQIFAFRGTTLVSGDPISANGTLIGDGSVSNQSANNGELYNLTYQQQVQGNDAVLSGGNSYHGIVTYTAAVSL